VDNPIFTVNMYLCAMSTRPIIPIQDFDYLLPNDKIAFTPAPKRDESKLIVWDKAIIAEDAYKNIANHIPADTVLVFNNSKVIAARVLFNKQELLNIEHTKSAIEIFCLEPTIEYCPVQIAMQSNTKVQWVCLVGGAKKWKEKFLTKILIHQGQEIILNAEKIDHTEGKFIIEFSWNNPNIIFSEILNLAGLIPLPPYIQRKATEQDKDRYQTTYAVEEGSVAAPTAGLHFSKSVFESLLLKNIQSQFVTLHVGAGTFMPVKSETIDQHIMHAEFIDVQKSMIEFLLNTNEKIIAVGTTSLRTLESLYWLGIKILKNNKIKLSELLLTQWEASDNIHITTSKKEALTAILNWMQIQELDQLITTTQLIITPGYQFRICNGLVTNFHQPKSTLLLIIAAIVGAEWRPIYQHALDNEYRFLSYGDGCLLWINQ
jgi:S-adenosylmethionine:tRNA ribosyltransferase-isomerase